MRFSFGYSFKPAGSVSTSETQVDIIYDQTGVRPTIIHLTELDDNPGMSITNAAEYVRGCLVNELKDNGMNIDNLIHIEQYNHNGSAEYSQVNMKQDEADGIIIFANPGWCGVTVSQFEDMVRYSDETHDANPGLEM